MKKDLLRIIGSMIEYKHKDKLNAEHTASINYVTRMVHALPENEMDMKKDEQESLTDQAKRLNIEHEQTHPKRSNSISEMIRIPSYAGI